MESGLPCFHQDSSCPGVLRIFSHQAVSNLATGLSPSLTNLPRSFAFTYGFLLDVDHRLSTTDSCYPHDATGLSLTRLGFGLFPFRSPLLRESHFDFFSCWYLDGSLPSVSPQYTMCSCTGKCHPDIWVTPFGYLRIVGYVLLPSAFRSLSRPSSSGGS